MIQNKIQELPSNQNLEIEQITTWLDEYENYFYFLINETNCRKWSRWQDDKTSHILPCCCPKREEDCIFIELYYELNKLIQLHKKEAYFKNLVDELNQLKNDKTSVIDWVIKARNVYKTDLKYLYPDSYSFCASTRISDNSDESSPYQVYHVKIKREEFKYALEIKEIFEEIKYLDFI